MPLKIIFKFLKFFEILLALKIASIKSLAVRLETVCTVHAIAFVFIVYFGMSFAVPAEKILAWIRYSSSINWEDVLELL